MDFGRKHADALQPLLAWFNEAEDAVWSGPTDIKREYPSASFLRDDRVVFNIKGNTYRVIVHVSYAFDAVYIKFIGTHAEYDKIDAATVGAPKK